MYSIKKAVLEVIIPSRTAPFATPKLAHSLRFPIETSHYALVAKALRYKIAFSTTPKSENLLVVENQGIIEISN